MHWPYMHDSCRDLTEDRMTLIIMCTCSIILDKTHQRETGSEKMTRLSLISITEFETFVMVQYVSPATCTPSSAVSR